MASNVVGMDALQRRLSAIPAKDSRAVQRMKLLGAAANREQKILLYQGVRRMTGQSGREITFEAATALRVLTVARGTAALAATGTRPHIIRPRYKKVLAWGGLRRLSGSLAVGGKPTHFAKLVHHPGTRPHDFMVRGAEQALSKRDLANEVIIRPWNDAA